MATNKPHASATVPAVATGNVGVTPTAQLAAVGIAARPNMLAMTTAVATAQSNVLVTRALVAATGEAGQDVALQEPIDVRVRASSIPPSKPASDTKRKKPSARKRLHEGLNYGAASVAVRVHRQSAS